MIGTAAVLPSFAAGEVPAGVVEATELADTFAAAPVAGRAAAAAATTVVVQVPAEFLGLPQLDVV